MHAGGPARAQTGPRGVSPCRRRFLDELSAALGPETARQTTVVFDASVHPGDFALDAQYRGLGILFALGDENADARIEQLIARHSNPKTLTVVSSDNRIRQAASRRRTKSLTADQFWELIDDLKERGRIKTRSEATPQAGSRRFTQRGRHTTTRPTGSRRFATSTSCRKSRRRLAQRSALDRRRHRRDRTPGSARAVESGDSPVATYWRRRHLRSPAPPGNMHGDRGKTKEFMVLSPGPEAAKGISLKNQDARAMKVHEYQAKELLKKAGVAVPEGIVATTPAEAAKAYDALGGGLIVVKAQVHAGGRGKGVADRARRRSCAGARDRQRAASRGPSRWPRGCNWSSRPRKPKKPPPACWARHWSPIRPVPRGARSPRCWSRSGTTSPASSTWGWRSTAACSARS